MLNSKTNENRRIVIMRVNNVSFQFQDIEPFISTVHKIPMNWNYKKAILFTFWKSVTMDGLWVRHSERAILVPFQETMSKEIKLISIFVEFINYFMKRDSFNLFFVFFSL